MLDKSPLILAIDDSQLILTQLKLLIENQTPCHFIGFDCGFKALESDEIHLASLILLDMNMPSIDGVEMATSIEKALELVKDVDEVMIIGGGSIYESCLPKAHRLYLTYIDLQVEGDTQFPSWGNGWNETHRESYQADEKNAYSMDFVVLER